MANGNEPAWKEDQLTLVFFYTKKTMKVGKGKNTKVRPTLEATQSETVLKRAFDLSESSDATLGLAARHYRCIKVDLTNVSKKDNKHFNTEKAPLVLLIDRGGKISKSCKGAKSCTQSKISSAMLSHIKKSKLKDAYDSIKDINKVLAARFDVEMKLSKQNADISTGRSRLASARQKKASKSVIRKMEKALARAEKELKELQEERAGLLKKEEALLTSAGQKKDLT